MQFDLKSHENYKIKIKGDFPIAPPPNLGEWVGHHIFTAHFSRWVRRVISNTVISNLKTTISKNKVGN